MYIGTLYSCSILMTLEFSRQIFEKYSNIKFHENPSSGSRVVPCGWTDGRTDSRTDGRTDMMKLIVAFRNFANAPHKKCPNLLAISFHQELPKQFNSLEFLYLYQGRPTFYDREQQPLL